MGLLLAICASLAISGCAHAPLDYDAYDYGLNGLTVGVAFPPLRDAREIGLSVAACSELGFGWVRHQESWANREPERDAFNWEPMDARMEALSSAGIRVLLTLSGHEWPDWLGSTGSRGEAATLAEFRQYVAALLERYAGRIDRIQFGNEWNWEIDEYMAGDEAAFVAYANILYEEAQKLPSESRPTVVLGSLNGLAYLAFDQGLVRSIVIEGREPYADEIAAYLAAPDRSLTELAGYVLSNADYDMLDIHVYDDHANWPAYLQALRAVELMARGANSPVIVSEFGGPYPVTLYGYFGGRPAEAVLAEGLVDYLRALDSMDVEEVYFFALAEGGSDRNHPDSYLYDSSWRKTAAHEVMRRFAEANR